MQRKAGFVARSRAHLDEAKEGYREHLAVASGIGSAMILAGSACVIHGLIPGVFTDRASKTIRRLNDRIAARQHQSALAEALHQLEYEI
jgi:hypothetical protein